MEYMPEKIIILGYWSHESGYLVNFFNAFYLSGVTIRLAFAAGWTTSKNATIARDVHQFIDLRYGR